MPACFGHSKLSATLTAGESVYGDVTQISLQYRTDEKPLRQLLPHPYELEGPPVLTVAYSMNRDIDWLAGGEYNIIDVSVRAIYIGEADEIRGDFALVLWENLTDPILTGREMQGIPKIYGQIEDHKIQNGIWKTSLSNRGQTILDVQAEDLVRMAPNSFETFKENCQQRTLLGWKYIPNETLTDAIASYATVFPIDIRCHEAWSAKGSLRWYPQTWEKNPTQAHIVNCLHSLPVYEILSCIVSKSSITLKLAKVRRLK
jgi:acetoacetate decarboxylase